MLKATDFILPAVIFAITAFGAVKGVKIFDAFIEGAKKGLKTAVGILPALIALVVAVDMLRSSGALVFLCDVLTPIANLTGIPKEVLPLTILTPISGSGALTMYESILRDYGADGVIGRTASILMCSTETTFYAITIYFGSVAVKNTRHTLPCAVCANIVSYMLSAQFVSMGI
ncbi:MAG: Spore maturation protein B [Firmicutes bacterium ADurb.Bin300]|jgi:spore maturation protein B|nr:MAG: Spore maturation protein B [Firmicutes bacterium ADurb.Bin300]